MFVWRVFPGRAEARPGAFLAVPALEGSGIRLAFTNRTGGVSAGPHASMNLSHLFGDDEAAVHGNRAHVLGTLGVPPDAWTGAKQVHEARVAEAVPANRGSGAFDAASTLPGVDGLWTEAPGVAVAVLAADCLPVVVADRAARRVAALHAGWRGLTAGILEHGIDALAAAGSRREDLVAFVGPAIGPCYYEVDDDVAAAARDALGPDLVVKGHAKPHVDLWTGSRLALANAGVRNVWLAGLCTRCEPHRFFSHRAGAQGRQGAIAVIA